MLARSNGETIPFDTVAAKVVSESNYVLVGEKYKADVFIAAFNKTLKTDVLSGEYDLGSKTFKGAVDSVPVVKGMGKYTAAASSEGFKKVKGIIRMITPKGKTFEYPYESEYIVARPALTVSADNMNVLYAGLANPISVSVPGVPNSRLQVHMENGELVRKGDGKYDVTNAHAGKAYVSVTAEMENGEKKSMGKLEFRVKNLPKPTAKVGELTTSGKMKKEILALQTMVQCFYDPSFDFKTSASVVSFSFSYLSSSTNMISAPITVKGNQITPEIQRKIKSLRRGDVVSFDDIHSVGADKVSKGLDPITIMVQ
ncbi:MAG: GldM family protein [Bacteroidia bacterium]